MIRSIGAMLACGFAAGAAFATDINLTLTGANEVPAVSTSAIADGSITVDDDGTISGSVRTSGIAGTAAHIHEGAVGNNGPVIVPLTKSGDIYSVPAGTTLTVAQLQSFKAGNLYVNVHSAANPNGELRAQLK
jgi:hypothetical protein